jgi:hypothetical protein
MFEVGKRYSFVTVEGYDGGLAESTQQWNVAAIEGTLLYLHDPAITEGATVAFVGSSKEQNMTLNTASCFFHSAQLVESDCYQVTS